MRVQSQVAVGTLMYQPSAGCHTEREARYGLFDEP